MSYFYDSELDRKSSRGMIYENEELRLRTININAEVERGQSDIKRLRRENEHLRREIWTLRDECDRLNKRFKARLLEHEHGAGSCGGRHSGHCDGAHSNCNSDDSDSCDSCKGNDDQCSDECCAGGSCTQLAAKQPLVQEAPETPNGGEPRMTASGGDVPQTLHNAFDHLSVVSEETLSSSELQAQAHNEQLLGYTPDGNGSQMTIPNMVGPLTPLTPIEQVANQLNDLQAMVPPLSYFENVLQQHMGSNIGKSPLSPTTAQVVRHTNGWDYNLQSPFAQRKYESSSSPSPPTIKRSPLMQQRFAPAPPPTLSTFASSVSVEQPPEAPSIASGYSTADAPPTVETVAITTMPTNAAPLLNSPKHFFAPLKPRLKINTSLANKAAATAPPTTITNAAAATTTTASKAELQNCEPPDIYVANALASPYQRQQVLPSAVPPPLPQRGSSSQVSPRHRPRAQQQRHQQHHQHQHQQLHHQQLHQHQHQQQQQLLQPATQQLAALAVAETDGDDVVAAAVAAAAAANDGRPTAAFAAMPINNNTHLPRARCLAAITAAAPAATPTAHAENPNTLLTKLNEPIYATAQKGNKLISAPAVTKPLMVAAIASNRSGANTATARRATPSPTPSSKSTATKATLTTITVDSESQTDSVNLETILNDIETISEDILAIQMEKKKLRDHQNGADVNKPLQGGDKNKKPYRSEMNLMLQYDGANSTITPTRAAIAIQTSALGGDSSNGRCTRSLEREHTDSPSPHLPDPMTPFPDKRTYIGFDQLNSAASGGVNAQKPPLPPAQVVATASTPSGLGTPTKPPPPTPPARIFPPSLNIRGAGLARATPVPTPQTPTVEQQAMQTALVPGLAPNKSHLYAAVANAAAKRAQFDAAPSHLARSLEVDVSAGQDNELDSPALLEDSNALEATKRKARRVSIICGETSAPATPDHAPNQSFHRSQAQIANTNTSNIATTAQSNSITTNVTTTHPATGSCIDLPSVLVNPALKSLKQSSHSTPSTPHSARRRSNNTQPPNAAELTTQSAHSSPQHHGHYQQQQQPPLHINSSCSNLIAAQQRKSSQDSTRDLAAAAAIVARSKCSRRHSDGTVASNAQRASGNSNNGIGGHHHHRHHHRHQHSASVISNNPHHSHHSHQDSNQETGTSASDGNSNSLASSRESSTSFSVRSQRRKISVSSHTGGKIPWCGCWGNGCL